MKAEIKEVEVIPRQSTTDSIVEFAKIHQIFPCNKDGLRVNSRTEDSMHVRVYVSSTSSNNSVRIAGIVYNYTDYKQFRDSYGLAEFALIGRPALAVYNNDDQKYSLSGIIPLGRSVKISLKR